MRDYDETTHANVHRGVYAIAEEATRRFEAARANVGRFIGAPVPGRGDRLHQERHRGPQPGGPHLGPHPPRAGRRDRAHRDGAPRQHRPLAHAGRRARHRAPVDPGRRRRPPGPRRPRPTARRGQAGRRHLHVERARHAQPDRRHRRRRPTPPVRSWWPTAPSRCPHLPTDVTRARRRLPGLQRPQDARSDRHRRAVGSRGAARRRFRRSSAAAR